MQRPRPALPLLGVALWMVASVLLFVVIAPTSAQEATPAAIGSDAGTTETTDEREAVTSSAAGGTEPAAMPTTGVGPGTAAPGGSPFAIGAAVGAVVAAIAAFRERLQSR